ncbi:MAG: hypothetical protein JNM78_06565 [Cyclobacteriaceae bacterium]|nr:hypothetical protein [Cyclobacteriaceae bacterium]
MIEAPAFAEAATRRQGNPTRLAWIVADSTTRWQWVECEQAGHATES